MILFLYFYILLSFIKNDNGYTIIIENKIVILIMHNINYKTLNFCSHTFHLRWKGEAAGIDYIFDYLINALLQ